MCHVQLRLSHSSIFFTKLKFGSHEGCLKMFSTATHRNMFVHILCRKIVEYKNTLDYKYFVHNVIITKIIIKNFVHTTVTLVSPSEQLEAELPVVQNFMLLFTYRRGFRHPMNSIVCSSSEWRHITRINID